MKLRLALTCGGSLWLLCLGLSLNSPGVFAQHRPNGAAVPNQYLVPNLLSIVNRKGRQRFSKGLLAHINKQLFVQHSTKRLQTLTLGALPPVRVLLETRRVLTQAERQELSAQGVHFLTSRKGLLQRGSFYGVELKGSAAWLALEQHHLVKKVQRHVSLVPQLRPLLKTAADIQAYALHQWRESQIPVRGKGVLIGSIDSGIDIFHPQFFRADGKHYAWIDKNNDGTFTPCVDAVDLDGDGQAGDNESLCCLQSRLYDLARRKFFDPGKPAASECRAGLDWVYHDPNGNKTRDYGPDKGFQESDPSYGERLFVIDDVNKNGRLDPEEKIVALRTSKVRATYIAGVERTRGKDLIMTTVGVDPYSYTNAMHGTGSSSVMVGGQVGFSTHLGIAPDADLVVASSSDARGQEIIEQAFLWIGKQQADVVLHEYAYWEGYFLDGTSAHEKMLTQAGKDGQIQICPTGNLGGSAKHATLTIKPGTTTTLKVDVPATVRGQATQTAIFTLLWQTKAPVDLKLTMIFPDGTRVGMQKNNVRGRYLAKNVIAYDHQSRSEAGTTKQEFNVLGYESTTQQYVPLPPGNWTLEIVSPPDAEELAFHAYTRDAASGWGRGVAFLEHVNNDGLAGWPSTANGVLAVGAYTGRDDGFYGSYYPEKHGKLRAYSSGGPRIDGTPLFMITAPDNPRVAISPEVFQGQTYRPFGQSMIYGGTSGASPHVAAAVALLKQIHPDWNQEKVNEAIKQGALVDKDVDVQVPHKRWGFGKLRIYKALMNKDPEPNTAPTIAFVPEEGIPVERVSSTHFRFVQGRLPASLTMQAKDDEDPKEQLRISWDPGYTGTWSDKMKGAILDWPLKEAGFWKAKVRVTDQQNASSAVLLTIEVQACQDDVICGDGFLCQEGQCIPTPKPEPKPEPMPEPAPTQEPTSADGGTGNQPDTSTPPPNTGCGCQTQSQGGAATFLCLFLFLGLVMRRSRSEVTKCPYHRE